MNSECDSISLAALQARALLDSGKASERDMAEVAVRNRRLGKSNPNAQVTGDFEAEALLAEPYLVSPLRRHDCPPISDGAAAVVIAAREAVGRGRSVPVWIRGLDHRLDTSRIDAKPGVP